MQPGSLALVPPILAWVIGGHMMLQTAYTVAVHTRAVSEQRRAKPFLIVIAVIAIFVAYLAGAYGDRILPAPFGSEALYRLFMAFYGLIFPAYVWLYIVPFSRSGAALAQNNWVILAIAVAIAGPMFWLGFINDHMIWLVPGLLVVVLSRTVGLIKIGK
jgi:hypothetical protein